MFSQNINVFVKIFIFVTTPLKFSNIQILLNASMNGFRRKILIYGKNGAIKYITHLDKFSYFPKHYNFHEIML